MAAVYKPWERIALTEEQLQIIYREWGIFYTHKQKMDIAADYYDISLKLKDDPKALYLRSKCKRSIAQTELAILDAKAAMATDPRNQPVTLEVCDGLYQLNQLEKAKCELFNHSLKFKGLKLREFHHRTDALNENFDDILGDTLGLFILEHEKVFFKALEAMKRETFFDPRPLWKILREEGECDVISVLEKEEEILSPIEVARRKRAYDIFNQIYMRKSWVDVVFLRTLKSDPNLLLPQSQWSRPILENVTQIKYDATIKFMQMLHSRSPVYTEKVRNCPSKKLAKKRTEDYLYRVQYQIHRNMLAILKRIKYLRQAQQVEKLTNYVEEVMGDYTVLKTHRVMPWKFKFINEVYNLLALTYVDRYVNIPKNIFDYDSADRLNMLLKMSREKDKEPSSFVFGDRSTHQDPDAADMATMKYKKFLARMEKRIIFAKYPIEKAYVWHEIARSHLKAARFDESCVIARRSIDEARKCNSQIWTLLGYIMICKSHATMRKIEKINETLLEASKVVKNFEDPKVKDYIDLLIEVNAQDALEKKIQEDFRKTKSSRHSMLNQRKSSVVDY